MLVTDATQLQVDDGHTADASDGGKHQHFIILQYNFYTFSLTCTMPACPSTLL